MKVEELANGNVSICDIDEGLISIIICGLAAYIDERSGERCKNQREQAQGLLDVLDEFYSAGCW